MGRISKRLIFTFTSCLFVLIVLWNELFSIRSQLVTIAGEMVDQSKSMELQLQQSKIVMQLLQTDLKASENDPNNNRLLLLSKEEPAHLEMVDLPAALVAEKVVHTVQSRDGSERQLDNPTKAVDRLHGSKNAWEGREPQLDIDLEPKGKYKEPDIRVKEEEEEEEEPHPDINIHDGTLPKPDFQKPLPEWKLLEDNEMTAKLVPLPGEGLISSKIAALKRSGRGVLFNAIHRDVEAQRPSRNIMEALRASKRMRMANMERGVSSKLQYVLFTEKQPYAFMMSTQRCRTSTWPDCAEFAQDKGVFDFVKFYEDLDQKYVIQKRDRFQAWPDLWLKRIYASLNSPFELTLVVDSDVYACTKFEDIFSLISTDFDIAMTLAPAPYGSSRNYAGAFRKGRIFKKYFCLPPITLFFWHYYLFFLYSLFLFIDFLPAPPPHTIRFSDVIR